MASIKWISLFCLLTVTWLTTAPFVSAAPLTPYRPTISKYCPKLLKEVVDTLKADQLDTSVSENGNFNFSNVLCTACKELVKKGQLWMQEEEGLHWGIFELVAEAYCFVCFEDAYVCSTLIPEFQVSYVYSAINALILAQSLFVSFCVG